MQSIFESFHILNSKIINWNLNNYIFVIVLERMSYIHIYFPFQEIFSLKIDIFVCYWVWKLSNSEAFYGHFSKRLLQKYKEKIAATSQFVLSFPKRFIDKHIKNWKLFYVIQKYWQTNPTFWMYENIYKQYNDILILCSAETWVCFLLAVTHKYQEGLM